MDKSTIGQLGLLKAMVTQATKDMLKDEETDGFPTGTMAALDFFHSQNFCSLCDGAGIDPSALFKWLGIPDTYECQCYQCRTDYTAEATAVAKFDGGGEYWFAPATHHNVVWDGDLIVEIMPLTGDPSSWMTAQEFLRGEQ